MAADNEGAGRRGAVLLSGKGSAAKLCADFRTRETTRCGRQRGEEMEE